VKRRQFRLGPGDRLLHQVEFGAHRQRIVQLAPARFDRLVRAHLRDAAQIHDRAQDLVQPLIRGLRSRRGG
jgi:hypothetical protein